MNHFQNISVAKGEKPADLVLKNATYLNVFTNEFLQNDIAISNGYFVGIGKYEGLEEINIAGEYLIPGFIDSHIHLESSIVSPPQFTKAVLPHGTTTLVTDPHEITNILGDLGIDYLLETTSSLPLDIFFMLPSCVPASPFDENGFNLDSNALEEIIKKYSFEKRILGLAEIMNFPGVIFEDQDTLKKLAIAKKHGFIIDGHAPNLKGKNLNAYIGAGISSDHEATSFEEALEKLQLGQWIMIREGTACQNLLALLPLFTEKYYSRCLLATDDIHPEELLIKGHIDHLVRKAILNKANPIYAFKMASFNCANYFGLKDRGAIAPGYLADFIILDNIEKVKINSVYKKGIKISRFNLDKLEEKSIRPPIAKKINNSINIPRLCLSNFKLKKKEEKIIELIPGQILTNDGGYASKINLEKDILKICVVERHKNTGHLGIAFLKGYGLKSGAIATTISHDSHNIVVVGTNDDDIFYAIKQIKKLEGGMVVVENQALKAKLALPIAGIMSNMNLIDVKEALENLKKEAYALGVNPQIDPFMTLSFICLPVIPNLKLTTLGVVDVNEFKLLD